MYNAYLVIRALARGILSILELAILLRAVLSWILPLEDSAIGEFLIAVTEPILRPIRGLMQRLSFFAALPVDIAPIIACLLLHLLQSIL